MSDHVYVSGIVIICLLEMGVEYYLVLNKIIIPTFPPSIRVIVLVLVRRMVI